MSRAELDVCVSLDKQLQHDTQRYNAEVKAFNALVKEANVIREALIAMEAGFKQASESGQPGTPDEASIAAYNAKVDEYNAIVERQRAHQTRMNDIAAEHEVSVKRFNARCANRNYQRADMRDLERR